MKDSSRLYFDRADAYVIVGGEREPVPWEGIPARWLAAKPRFPVEPPEYSSDALTAFVAAKLKDSAHG